MKIQGPTTMALGLCPNTTAPQPTLPLYDQQLNPSWTLVDEYLTICRGQGYALRINCLSTKASLRNIT